MLLVLVAAAVGPRVAFGAGDAGASASTTQAAPSTVNLPWTAPAPGPGSKDAVDRETPRRTIQGFLKEALESDYTVAASYLDLDSLAPTRRVSEGPELARKLAWVLLHRPRIDLAKVPDQPEGEPGSKTPDRIVVDTIYVGEDPVNIAVERVRFPDGVDRWLIARTTVASIPILDAAYGPRPIGIPMPSALVRVTVLGNAAWQWIGCFIALVAAYLLARVLAAGSVRLASTFTKRMRALADVLVESARRPLRMVYFAALLRALIEPLQLTNGVVALTEHVTYTLFVIGIAWVLSRALGVVTRFLDAQTADTDSVTMRRALRTRAVILQRVATITVIFIAGGFLLVQFALVRSIGVSLLASAGVVSVVVGFAAQRSLAAIIGGVQFSFAQPVRIGDAVVVESEFGEVEEIFLTYAVVRLWDKRRMVLPITYFLDKPFQNWTRSGTDLLGAVTVRADYGVPLDPLRQALRTWCEADPNWDKGTCSLQVVDCDNVAITLRALVSAGDASRLWDLRCNVREKLLGYLATQEEGKYLPRGRGPRA